MAFRYLRARRKEGGVALISVISFVGVMLAVAVLVIVMSVMNGFRHELLGRMLGFNGHLYVSGQILSDPARRQAAINRIKAIPGVTEVAPMVEAEAMVMAQGQITGAIVRGVRRSDLQQMPLVANNIRPGSIQGYGQGDLHVRVQVEVPTKLDANQKAKLHEFAALCDGKEAPIASSFFEKAKKFFK